MAASYLATIRDARNRLLARGRTANISETGVLVVVRRSGLIPETGEIIVDLLIPADPVAGTKREVSYRCRIARRQELANLIGLGLEFLEKVA